MMAGICWPSRRPRCVQVLPRVGGLVDAVAVGEIGPLQALAAADVDDVRVGRRDGEGADGAGRLVVEDRLPGAAVVGGLPDAAVVDADVEDVGLAGHAGGADGAAAAERADHAPAQAGVERRGEGLRGGAGHEAAQEATTRSRQRMDMAVSHSDSRCAPRLPAHRCGGIVDFLLPLD